jgi:proteasome lid subunit RPN8/RPN11
MDLEVTSGAIATLLEEATLAAPHECCGLLLGQGQRIDRAVPAANLHSDPSRHFEIDPAVLIPALRAERQGGARVIGYYHSHPNGLARPSAEDRACASGDGRIWAIVAAGAVTWWRDDKEGFEALSLRLVEG